MYSTTRTSHPSGSGPLLTTGLKSGVTSVLTFYHTMKLQYVILITISRQGGPPSDVHMTKGILARRNLAWSVIGGIRETEEMLNFCSKHNIASDIEVTAVQKVNDVVKSDVRYRFVIDMKSL